jgi:hypothetical protein
VASVRPFTFLFFHKNRTYRSLESPDAGMRQRCQSFDSRQTWEIQIVCSSSFNSMCYRYQNSVIDCKTQHAVRC